MALHDIVILVAIAGSQMTAIIAVLAAAFIASRKVRSADASIVYAEPTQIKYTAAPLEQPEYDGPRMQPPGGLSPESQLFYEKMLQAKMAEEEIEPPAASPRPRNRYVEPD